MPSIFRKPVNIDRGVYAMSMDEARDAEITMYGEIVASRPIDYRTMEPAKGSYIVKDEFLEDLESLGKAKSLTIRMNSLGGDAGVSILIHNRLRELAAKGTALTCIVDGVAMSGGSLIMCACDTVKVNPSSLIMIHNCWDFLIGGYNAAELREEAAACEAWDKAQVAIYKRKCGLEEAEITRMMAETTYMTGQEAIDKGFADMLLEDAEPLQIAASADGRSLFVRGREFPLCPGMFAPDSIPTARPGAEAPVGHTPPAAAGEGGISMEEKTTQAPAAEGTPPAPAAQEAGLVKAERQRLQEIDAIAALYDPALVQEAKYGKSACTAQELAYRAALQEAQAGKAFLEGMRADAQAAQAVGAAPPPEQDEPTENMTPGQRMDAARQDVRALLGKKEG